MRKPKIVIMGGGTGLPVILKSLRSKGCDLTAIVTVADDGGSSKDIREILGMAPPGDLRNVLVSLSEMPHFYHQLFQYRFEKKDHYLGNHSIGNLIIAAVAEMEGSTYEAVQVLSKIMRTDGQIFPVSEEPLTLHAVFTDGQEIAGESHIAAPRKEIDYVYVTNTYNDEEPKAARKVVKAILEADMVVLGPGSLYTSILPNLVIKEVEQAIKDTRAEVVYICNIMTQLGETEHFTDAQHVEVLNKHLGEAFIDTVLVNNEEVPENYIDYEKYDEVLQQVIHDFKGLRSQNVRVISTNFLKLKDGGVFHDGELVVDELIKVVFGPRY